MNTKTSFQFDDGGRSAAGFKGTTKDCVCRSIAIATGLPYGTVYERLNTASKGERKGKRKRSISSARGGVYRQTITRYMTALGWLFTPTMGIGTGCRVHLCAKELPAGRLIVSVSRHYTAVLDGVIHDTSDPSRAGRRCVYGYWTEARR